MDIKVGVLLKTLDPRIKPPRVLEIVEIDENKRRVRVRNQRTQRRTWISMENLHNRSQRGYETVH